MALSSVVCAELRYGAARVKSKKLAAGIEGWLALFTIVAWDDEAAIAYARIRAAVEEKGRPIGNLDLLIAAPQPAVNRGRQLGSGPKMVHTLGMHPKLSAVFYSQPDSNPPSQPVRAWLLALPKSERVEIGGDIQSVQFGWPMGLPLVRHLQGDLWEIRTQLPNRIARVIFAVHGDVMYLLHGFIKKTQRTPPHDLALAQQRWKRMKP